MSTAKTHTDHKSAAHANGAKPKGRVRLTVEKLMKSVGLRKGDTDLTAPPTANDFAYAYKSLVQMAKSLGVTKASKTPVFNTKKAPDLTNPTPEHVLEFGRLIFDQGNGGIAHDSGCDFQLMKVGWAIMQLAQAGGATGQDRSSIYTSGVPLDKASAQSLWEMAQFLKSTANSIAADGDIPGDMDAPDSLGEDDLGGTDEADETDSGDGDEPDGQSLEDELAAIGR